MCYIMLNNNNNKILFWFYNIVTVLTGLPGIQLWPAGGAAAGPQRAGSWEGAGGGDSAAQTESGQQLSRETQEDCPHHRGTAHWLVVF